LLIKKKMSEKFNPHSQKELRHSLRTHATAAECVLWKLLKRSQVDGLKFRRQHGIGPYVMDFYCPSIKLCIELDGSVHQDAGIHVHDIHRDTYLINNGISILRFDNEVVFSHSEYIIEKIREFAGGLTTPTPPSKGGEQTGK